ncbi:MAG: hemolysin family protein [Coriobacteriales bacterium]|jgi:putative hemolysin|nr:hemolysin family protein [Coriobacteriales bacterium]
MDIFFSILVTLLLIFVNGYFSMSEMALISARRAVLQQQIEEGSREQSRKAQKAVRLAQDSDRLLATIQVAITLVGFGASALAATSFSAPIVAWLQSFGIGWLSAISTGLAVVVITLIISYVSLIIGELVPKRIALSNAERMAVSVAGPIGVFERLASPVVTLLSASTNAVARVFGIKGTEDRHSMSEDDIKYLVTEQETLLDEEKRMIHEIFDLGDTVAREVMTPRVDMISIEDDATVRQTVDRMRGTGFSRVPVFHEVPDRIVGVAMVKDLLVPLIDDRDSEPITAYMRDPVFVPETKDILPLLGELQTSHQQIAIVVDEYGGTAGIITVEDIVEEIVGDISDEYDPDNKYQTQLSDSEWLIDGRLPTDDAIRLGFPVEEGEDYETIAGWLLDTIDGVPRIGDTFEVNGYVFKVQSMRRNRVSMLRVTRLPEAVVDEAEGALEADASRDE